MQRSTRWSVLGSQEIKLSCAQSEIKSIELHNRNLTCIRYRSSKLITTYPEGILILKIIKPPCFLKRNSFFVISSLKKAAEIHPCSNILLFWKHIIWKTSYSLFLVSKHIDFDWRRMDQYDQAPQHSLSTEKWTGIKLNTVQPWKSSLIFPNLLKVSNHWGDVRVCNCSAPFQSVRTVSL